MLNIEKEISPLIETQFPSFYREEGQKFIAFVKAYYEWLEENNYVVNNEDVSPKTLYYTRRLLDIRDIDRTTSDFISHFKEKYLAGITLEPNTDVRNLLKHSLELYRSKGSQRSVELLFSLLYNEPVEIYLPGKDILKPSDGTWFIPIYLELEPNDLSKTYIGKQIFGASSQARALVEGLARRNINGRVIDVLYISSVDGNFTVGELISDDTITPTNPRIVGSLTNIVLNNAGKNFAIGDIVDVVSSITGAKGKARITNIESATGQVDYQLLDGGTGYSANADVIVSEKVLTYSSFNTANSFLTKFSQLEEVFQPLANVVIQAPQGNLLDSNNLILGVNSTPSIVCAGYVYGGNTSATTKFLSISVHDVANAVISSITNANTSGSFVLGEKVFQANTITGSNSFFGTVVLANSSTVLLDVTVGSLTNGVILRGISSNCSANIVSHVLINGNFSDADDIQTAGNSAIGNCIIDTVTNETASGLVVGSDDQNIGVYNITNNFRSPSLFTKAYIKNAAKTKTANISAVSTGDPGGFEIGSIVDTEDVFIGTDTIGGNNASNVPYLSITLGSGGANYGFVDSITINNGGSGYANSDTVLFTGGTPTVNAAATVNTYANGTIERITVGTPGSGYDSTPTISFPGSAGIGANVTVNMDFGWGFPKLVDADLTTIISLALTREKITIGTIASLTAIDPGSLNTASPFALVIEPAIAGFGRKNFTVSLNNVTSPFSIGEELIQSIPQPGIALSVSNVSGTFNDREIIEQTRSDGNVVYGELISANITSNTGTITVLVSNTSNTFDTSNSIIGLETFYTANVTATSANSFVSIGKGIIIGTTDVVANTVTLQVQRRRFATSFTSNISVSGSTTGSSGNVVSLSEISNSPVMGNNAIVSSVAGISNGTVQSVEVVDSGFAYRENELINLEKPGNPFVATGYVRLEKQGIGEGFWTTTQGFLDANKYIIDSTYYQEFSFEIQSTLTLDKYADMVKQLVQVAGTKLFGTIKTTSLANLDITTTSSVTVE